MNKWKFLVSRPAVAFYAAVLSGLGYESYIPILQAISAALEV